MKKIALALILIGFYNWLPGVSVSGYVVDEESGESIVGVNVVVKSADLGAATDLQGFFVIRNLSPGQCLLELSHIAYQPKTLSLVLTTENRYLDQIKLTPQTLQTRAVTVSGQRSDLIEKQTDIASFTVDPLILIETPQFSKDVFKLVKYSPSVTISDPFSPQYHVRGSDPGENLVQLDGMTIYNPQHFLASEAIFNPYSIKNIEMLVGGFDARFGGRNASILNITTREGHHHEMHGEFRPSVSGISGAIEFLVGEDFTAMFSGRFLTDLMSRVLIGSPNLMADINGVCSFGLARTNFRLSTFYAYDFMNYNIEDLILYFPNQAFDKLEESFITHTDNTALGLQSRTVLGANFLFNSHLYYSSSYSKNHTHFGFEVEDEASAAKVLLDFNTRIKNRIEDITWKGELNYFTRFKQTWQLGMEINRLRLYNQSGEMPATDYRDIRRGTVQAIFLQDKIDLDPFLVKLGLRYSAFRSADAGQPEPRVSLSVRLNPITRLKFSYGHYYQYLTTMDTQGSEFVQFLEYYNLLNTCKPPQAIHYIAGLEGRFSASLEYSLTAYYKNLARLYRYTYGSQSDLNDQGNNIEAGQGTAYGIECLVQGSVERFSGWISYTYARGFRRYASINQGQRTLFDGDQPHNFKAVILYKLTDMITFSNTIQYTAGFPKTWEIGMYSHYTYDPFDNVLGFYPTSITPEKNNVRYPPPADMGCGLEETAAQWIRVLVG